MERSAPRRYRLGTMAYWAVAVLLVGFGYLGLLSIGAPFLLTGIAQDERPHPDDPARGAVAGAPRHGDTTIMATS